MWTLEEGIAFARELEKYMDDWFHTALAGSVLHKGESFKDVDIIVYPHNTQTFMEPETVVKQRLEKFGLEFDHQRIGGDEYPDKKLVYIYKTKEGKRVDILVLK